MKFFGEKNGFSLIEVLMAISVLTIGILSVAAMQINSIAGNSSAVKRTRAVVWSKDSMETLMGRTFSHSDLLDRAASPISIEGVYGLDCTDRTDPTPDPPPFPPWPLPNPPPPFDCIADGGPIVRSTDGGPGGDTTIFWNIADDYPVFGCKTIRVLVRRLDRGVRRTVSVDYIMMRPI